MYKPTQPYVQADAAVCIEQQTDECIFEWKLTDYISRELTPCQQWTACLPAVDYYHTSSGLLPCWQWTATTLAVDCYYANSECYLTPKIVSFETKHCLILKLLKHCRLPVQQIPRGNNQQRQDNIHGSMGISAQQTLSQKKNGSVFLTRQNRMYLA